MATIVEGKWEREHTSVLPFPFSTAYIYFIYRDEYVLYMLFSTSYILYIPFSTAYLLYIEMISDTISLRPSVLPFPFSTAYIYFIYRDEYVLYMLFSTAYILYIPFSTAYLLYIEVISDTISLRPPLFHICKI